MHVSFPPGPSGEGGRETGRPNPYQVEAIVMTTRASRLRKRSMMELQSGRIDE